MGLLRFPNPGSDIIKFISTFSEIYKQLKDTRNFDHDSVRDALINEGLVSSSGAIGKEAVKRSVRPDRSLDPLYNQVKMYSELYRMLGWYKPGTMNTNFNFTELSEYVANTDTNFQIKIFEECLLSIVFPNPLVENKGGNILRPFPLILKLASKFDGVIFRDEIILGILNLSNDKRADYFSNLISLIKSIRGNSKRLNEAIEDLSRTTMIQTNTLKNYTRFPLGSLKATGWFSSETVKDIYDRQIIGYKLIEHGYEKVKQLEKLIDIRHEEIAEFDLEIRGTFTLLTHYAFLERCGFDIAKISDTLQKLFEMSYPIIDRFKINNRQNIFYAPIQQATQEEIDYANELEKKMDS